MFHTPRTKHVAQLTEPFNIRQRGLMFDAEFD
uniref:Uncharacterized protein n=1 Tax=Coprothermobacter proteolyticus (strain ATCC 35245 / DSM 5265 / OCM 4 / BT) TaxID=309798 RepID=B5Y7M0_COPPD